ncbi:MAG: DNA repair protein RecO [Rikenellaceae bacterium]|nr:DNA repair protein RecO [Rikenellaceae bacterium]
MKTYKARGIVLHTVKYGDSGLVAYLYTEPHGRQTYLIQGVRSSRSRGNKAALFQPMFLLDYEGAMPRLGDMHRMREVSPVFPLSAIPFDVRKSTIALFMAEVLYRLVRESEANPHLFAFLEQAVQALDMLQEGVSNFHLWFLVKLSYFLGFYPGNGYAEEHYFDIMRGEFVLLPPSHRMMMERQEARLLGELMDIRVDRLGSIALNRNQRVPFLQELLPFIGYHADSIHTVKSLEILREVF